VINLDKQHLVLYGLLIVSAIGLTYFIESKVADKAESKYEAQKAISDQKDSANVQFQKQIADQVAQLTLQNTQLQEVNKQQINLVSTLTAQLQVSKTKDAVLPPPELASRIQTLAPGGTVTVVAGGYTLDQPEAISVAQNLEEVPVLTQQLADKDVIIKNDDSVISNEDKALEEEKQSRASDDAASAADKATLNQEIAAVKAEAKRSRLRWFVAGVVAGFTLGRIHNLTF
jgi:hypothetical protein